MKHFVQCLWAERNSPFNVNSKDYEVIMFNRPCPHAGIPHPDSLKKKANVGIPHPGKPAGFFESSVEAATADPDIRSSRSVMDSKQIADQFFAGNYISARNALGKLNAPTEIAPRLYDAGEIELWAGDVVRFNREIYQHARNATFEAGFEPEKHFSLMVESTLDGTKLSLQQVADRWFDSSIGAAKSHLIKKGMLHKRDLNGCYLAAHVRTGVFA